VAREFVAEDPLAQVVPFRDSDAIYKAMKKQLASPPNKLIHGAFFKNFELNTYIEKLEALYL
jgi:hypothetical protein